MHSSVFSVSLCFKIIGNTEAQRTQRSAFFSEDFKSEQTIYLDERGPSFYRITKLSGQCTNYSKNTKTGQTP
jgi:hypothetical protein